MTGQDLARISQETAEKLREYAAEPWKLEELVRALSDLALRAAVAGVQEGRPHLVTLLHAVGILIIAEREETALELLKDLVEGERQAMLAVATFGGGGDN